MQTEVVCEDQDSSHTLNHSFFLSTMSFSLSRSIEDAYVDPAGDTKSFSQCPVHMCGKPQR